MKSFSPTIRKRRGCLKKILSFVIVAMMVCVSFSLVSWDAASEDVTGPFAWRNTGYPSSQVVDQENPTHDGVSTMMDYNTWTSQSFTVGMTGELTSVAVWLEVLNTNRALNVQIWTTDGFDTPMSPIGTPVSVPSVDETGWLHVDLNEVIPVIVGEGYALVLSTNELQVCYWMRTNSDTYANGVPRTSSDQGGTWSAALAYDFAFKTYIGNLPDTIKKVAWHSSGSFALGVTGSDHIIHRYERISGTWSPFLSLNVGEVMHDVVFDAQPGYDRFYFVGQNTNNNEPLAYEFQYDPVGGSNLWPKTLGGINGAFYGVEHSNDGLSNNKFLAVGQNFGTGMPMAYWYDQNIGWKQVSSGLMSGDILTDASWDGGNYYYAVGRDGANRGVVYRFAVDSTNATKWDIPAIGSLNAIDWSPASIPEDYAVMVSEKGVGPGNVHTFDRNNLVTVWTSNDIFNDVHWHPHGDMAVIVGSDNTGTEGAVVLHYPGENTAVPCTHLLPTGAPPFYGVAVKGPTSPSSAIITGTGGGISFYPSALNQDTTITVNAVVPRLYWIGFNDTLMNNRLDQQVSVDSDYYFTLLGNYSEGWSNCEVFIQAWHDKGLTNATGSGYPATDDSTRNLAFTLYWTVGSPAATVGYPTAPDLEITTGGVTDSTTWAHPDPAQSHHMVQIPIHFGKQVRNADYGGVAPSGPNYSSDANLALNNPNSWDFNIVIRDQGNPSAFNRSYGEFGIHKRVSISVTGSPSGSAPPGTADMAMTTLSNVTYSANMDYWLNVSIPHLYQDGVINATNRIGAGNVSVQNIHGTAAPANSYIAGMPRYFPAAENTPMNVWGLNATTLPPAGNGTMSAGPWVTDFNEYAGHEAYTELQWWVTIEAGVPEGVYIAIITITVDS